MPHPKRLSLSIAGTAALALASLPLAVSPANAAKVTEGTTSSIGVVETSSNTSQFNLKTQDGQSLAQRSSVEEDGRGRGRGGRGNAGGALPAFLQKLFEALGLYAPTECNGRGNCT
jgi:hypothetical protein